MRCAPVILVVLSALALVSGGQSGSQPVDEDAMTPQEKFDHFSQKTIHHTELAEKATLREEKEFHENKASIFKQKTFAASDALHGPTVERRPDPDPNDPNAVQKHGHAAQYHRSLSSAFIDQGGYRVDTTKDPLTKLRYEAWVRTLAMEHRKHAEDHDRLPETKRVAHDAAAAGAKRQQHRR